MPLLDKDDIRDGLAMLDTVAMDTLNSTAYAILLKLTATQLAAGLSVVVDTPLSRLSLAESFAAVALQVMFRSSLQVPHALVGSVRCHAAWHPRWHTGLLMQPGGLASPLGATGGGRRRV